MNLIIVYVFFRFNGGFHLKTYLFLYCLLYLFRNKMEMFENMARVVRNLEVVLSISIKCCYAGF